MRATAFVLTAALLACGGPGEAARDAPPSPASPGVTGTPQDSLHLELGAAARVRAGEPVTFTLRVRNGSGRAVDLYLRGRTPTMDLVVETADGRPVWHRLEGAVIPAIALLHPLPAGGQLEVTATWDQSTRAHEAARPGHYRVRGALVMETGAREAPPIPLEIVPR
jgi:hypothetical protein